MVGSLVRFVRESMFFSSFSGFILLGFLATSLGFGKVGLSLVVGVGSLAGGALFGFLFGIPKMLQRKAGEVDEGGRAISNTNLEQVSDWLTAIIIGASLVQLREISVGLDWLAKQVSEGVGSVPEKKAAGYPVAYFSILYFFIGGFMFSYLFARIHLVKEFSNVEHLLARAVQKVEKVTEENQLMMSQLARTSSLPGFRELLKETGSADDEDPHKGRFGGERSAKGRTLSAKITPLGQDAVFCKVEMAVTGTVLRPLTGQVKFHLHPTFEPKDVVVVEAVENRASLTVTAYGAFTVGVECDEGTTRLELDLADEDLGGPPDWRKS